MESTSIPSVVIYFMHQEGFWDMSVYKPKELLLASINGCKGLVNKVDDVVAVYILRDIPVQQQSGGQHVYTETLQCVSENYVEVHPLYPKPTMLMQSPSTAHTRLFTYETC